MAELAPSLAIEHVLAQKKSPLATEAQRALTTAAGTHDTFHCFRVGFRCRRRLFRIRCRFLRVFGLEVAMSICSSRWDCVALTDSIIAHSQAVGKWLERRWEGLLLW
jgi:hypothetical protein